MRFLNFLIKPASSLCNLRCRYCFYEDEACNRSEKSMGIMMTQTVDALLSEAFSLIDPNGMVHFAFQGGEPTMAGLVYFRGFVARVKEFCPQGVQVSYSIQTNGMVLDEDWAEFFKDNDFLVGLSMDGFKELHNMNRVDIHGDGSWSRLCRSLSLLQRFNVQVNILCVVTAQCARKPEKVYTQLKKLGVSYMQFIPCMDPMNRPRGMETFSLTPDLYGSFLCRLFDLWYDDWKSGCYRSVRLFDDYIHIILGDQPGTCATCGQCGSYFVVEADGSVYPCDFYVLDEWKMGTLGSQSFAEIAASPLRAKFLTFGTEKPAECQQCRWRTLCNGGCKHDWISQDNRQRNYFCSSFQKFFSYAESRLLHIAREEYAALQKRS